MSKSTKERGLNEGNSLSCFSFFKALSSFDKKSPQIPGQMPWAIDFDKNSPEEKKKGMKFLMHQ